MNGLKKRLLLLPAVLYHVYCIAKANSVTVDLESEQLLLFVYSMIEYHACRPFYRGDIRCYPCYKR